LGIDGLGLCGDNPRREERDSRQEQCFCSHIVLFSRLPYVRPTELRVLRIRADPRGGGVVSKVVIRAFLKVCLSTRTANDVKSVRRSAGFEPNTPVPYANRRIKTVLRGDETWLPEWSGKLGGVQRCAVRSRGVFWGKPVFQLTASSQLAESLAWGRVQIQRDGTGIQAERRPD
jgi:hypothetical protein